MRVITRLTVMTVITYLAVMTVITYLAREAVEDRDAVRAL